MIHKIKKAIEDFYIKKGFMPNAIELTETEFHMLETQTRSNQKEGERFFEGMLLTFGTLYSRQGFFQDKNGNVGYFGVDLCKDFYLEEKSE